MRKVQMEDTLQENEFEKEKETDEMKYQSVT